MIAIKCVETGDLYLLEGNDEEFTMKVYPAGVAPLSGFMQEDNFLKMSKVDLEKRIALAKLTGFNYAFHAHVRALKLAKQNSPKMYATSTPRGAGKNYYQEFARKQRAKILSNPIIYPGTP